MIIGLASQEVLASLTGDDDWFRVSSGDGTALRFDTTALSYSNYSTTAAFNYPSAAAIDAAVVDVAAVAGPAPESAATAIADVAFATGPDSVFEDRLPDNALVSLTLGDELRAALQQAASLMQLAQVRANPLYAGVDGHGQTVVILDTGADLDHSFFGPDADSNGIADRILFQTDFFGTGDADASDGHGHGTHVAGIIGSQNSTYKGIAPSSNFIILKVLDNSGSGNLTDIEEAFQWVVANRTSYNIVAVSMSIGDSANFNSDRNTALANEVQTLWNSGIATVIAAGNSYESYNAPGVNGLAATTLAWGVASTLDSANAFSSFSQRSNTMTEIAAPGSNITSAYLFGGTATFSGTSMATPMISGLVALAQDLSQQVTDGTRLDPATILNIMRTTGVSISDGTTTVPRVDALSLMNGIVSFWQQSTGNADNIYGWRGDDGLSGQGGDDTIRGNLGNDSIDGGPGTDSAIFDGLRSAYVLTDLGGGSVRVVGLDGADTLTTVERLIFDDVTETWPLPNPPTITSNGSGDTAAVSIAENTTVVTTVIATHPATLTYSIVGGGDAAQFQINSSTGVLSFTTAPNFEAPSDADANNSYLVQVRASDGSLFDDQSLTINVSDVNETPSDFNGDGNSDILWRHTNGPITEWLMKGSSSFNQSDRIGGVGDPNWRVASSESDFNGDGVADLLWRHDNGLICLWLMDGSSITASSLIGGSGDPNWGIALG